MKNSSNTDYSRGINLIAQALDVGGVVLISVVVHDLYLRTHDLAQDYFLANLIASILTLFIFQNLNLYSSWRGRSKLKRMGIVSSAWITVIILLVVITALM